MPFLFDRLLANYGLLALTLSTSLVAISDNAFQSCSSLRTVIVPT